MTDFQRWAEIERIYHETLDRPTSERTAFLDQACANDPSLKREIDSLLEHDRKDDDLFDHQAIEVAASMLQHDDPDSLEPGSEIGPYRLIEEIACGGMGIVYRAEQLHPVRRGVAVKVIKPGMDSEHVIARFEAERQALALMGHPNIARVFDAGATPSGRLYFVMELVDGVPLTVYCAQHGLDLRQRLAIFVDICQAIQHAHQKGVIHRDIKPSNILVCSFDGKPTPKVIDFGIAKAMQEPLTERSMHTQVGSVIGTLEYMSPEQAGSTEDVDTRSDVYSLGAVLYELITGSPPINRAAMKSSSEFDIIRRILEEDFPRPSVRLSDRRLKHEVGRDLDWVVMMALEKDRARRYETVNGLARDVERYLAGEPVEAAPPSIRYRTRKFAARHRVALATASAFAVLLMGAVLVSARMAIRATRAERVASAVNNFLEDDLLAQASTFSQAGGKPDRDLKVRTALDRAAQRLAGKFDREPEVEAAIRDTIGQTYLDLGLQAQARQQLERALDLQRRTEGVDSPKALRTRSLLARASFVEGKYPQAEAQYAEVVDAQRRVLGPEHPDTLRAMTGLALVCRVQSKFARAESIQSEALAIQRRVLGTQHPDTLMSMGNLGIVYYQQGKYNEAEPLYMQALETQRRVLGPEHPDALRSMGNLALVYIMQGKYEQAEPVLEQTLQIRQRLLGPEHAQTLSSMNNLAGVYFGEGKYAEAEKLWAAVAATHSRVFGPEHPDTLMYRNNLALAYDELGRDADAEPLFQRVLEARRRVLGPEHPFTLSTMSYLGFYYQRRGRYAQALDQAKSAWTGLLHKMGAENPETTAAALDLALAEYSAGDYRDAESLARNALAVYRKKQPDSWQRYRAEALLGASLAAQRKSAEAKPLLTEGYREMLARKKRMRVPDWYHLELARQWAER